MRKDKFLHPRLKRIAMYKLALASILAYLLFAGSMTAHHSYGAYDRDAAVTLEGTLKEVNWANPHVTLKLETDSQGEYLVEWWALLQFSRQGIETPPVVKGDHVLITGSLNRNP